MNDEMMTWDVPARGWIAAACLWVGAGCDSSPGPGHGPDPVASGSPPGPAWFDDVTDRSGVRFTHVAGTNYFMPDQVGSGVALMDFNRDGRLDLYLVQNGGDRDGDGVRNQLFEQRENGVFANVSEGSGLDVSGRGMGAIAGDVNNDGWPDVVVTEYGATRLFQNLGGGKFREVTTEAGLENPRWAAPASFIDFDRDGWLDLVVGNYVDYDPTQKCEDLHGRRDFCAPSAYAGTATRLWRNATTTPGATPRLEDRTESAGLTRWPGVALGLVCADFDGDQWPDIFCSDDGRPNRLFLNRRDGTFSEEAAARGLALNAMGKTAANMGVAFGDVDGDGLADLFVTHLAEEFHALFRQDRRGLFVDAVAQAGLQGGRWRGTGFGTVLVDFDRDGDLDLGLVNGLVRRATPGQTPVMPGTSGWWGRYAQKPQVFANDGTGRFRDVSEDSPAFCGLAAVGRSLAVGDLDGDGAPDLVVGNIDGPVRVLRNVAPLRGRWLALRLVDPARGGRDAIGAEVEVIGGARKWWGVLQPATSYLASHEPAVHFGLGSSDRVTAADVIWPDGLKERFSVPDSNRYQTLERGAGQVIP
ncbi:MAG: CRTAC1 family protein [Limisphaerales bacterium]